MRTEKNLFILADLYYTVHAAHREEAPKESNSHQHLSPGEITCSVHVSEPSTKTVHTNLVKPTKCHELSSKPICGITAERLSARLEATR